MLGAHARVERAQRDGPRGTRDGPALARTATMSFRDPAGRLVDVDGRLLRLVHTDASPDVLSFLQSPFARRLERDGHLVTSRIADDELARGSLADGWGTVLEHERVPFASFPYEWPPEMLYAAGRLTLDLAEEATAAGWALKDASPFNVLFRGTVPVFVDLPSFERRPAGATIWLPYAQFVRTFILPLLANKHFGFPLRRIFDGHREGLEPLEVYRFCSWRQRLSPDFLTLATIPTLFAGRALGAAPRQPAAVSVLAAERAAFVTKGIFRHLRRALHAARPRGRRRSRWSSYTSSGPHDERYHVAKRSAVERLLRDLKPRTVLDIGANDGHIARVAARGGARVVAIDRDESAVGAAFDAARTEALDVLSLVVDLIDPPGATGWRNRECRSFLDRAAGQFDAVLLLAVVHHLMVSGGVPLDEVIALVAEVTRDAAVIEFVPRDDVLFQQLARGREAMYEWLTPETFEEVCRRHFRLEGTLPVGESGRRLYLLRRS